MDIYSLSRNFFDWSFENPEKITPTHTALYFFAIEHCNRLGWKGKFGFPIQMSMDAIGIKSYHTHSKVFKDLVSWGFFALIQKSTNQYSANIISLSNALIKNDKALDKATAKHVSKQQQSTRESKSSIDIHSTNVPMYQDTNIQDISKDIGEQALEVSKGNEDINNLLKEIQEIVESLGFIYKKGKYERERAKNILTGKDFGSVCEKSNMSRTDFCKSIIIVSSKLDFWRGKVNNAETLYKYYAQVYNYAVNKKEKVIEKENEVKREIF